jgi:hypothetical protein
VAVHTLASHVWVAGEAAGRASGMPLSSRTRSCAGGCWRTSRANVHRRSSVATRGSGPQASSTRSRRTTAYVTAARRHTRAPTNSATCWMSRRAPWPASQADPRRRTAAGAAQGSAAANCRRTIAELRLVAMGIVSNWPSRPIALKKCDRAAGRLRVTASVAKRSFGAGTGCRLVRRHCDSPPRGAETTKAIARTVAAVRRSHGRPSFRGACRALFEARVVSSVSALVSCSRSRCRCPGPAV